MFVCSLVVTVAEFGATNCSSHKAYLSVVCTNRARASERTVRVTLMFIWVAKISHFIIPCLYMKGWGSVSVRGKKTQITRRVGKNI